MNLSITLTLNSQEIELLKKVLGISNNLEQELAKIGQAGIEEYVRMFLGQKIFTRGSDIREYRLFLLIQTFFNNRIPEEQQVSDIFQTKITESRSLIRSVLAKYQYELRESFDNTLKELMESHIDQSNEKITAVINSDYKIEELNRILSSIDGSLPSVKKKRESVSTYEFERSSLNALNTHFGIANE
ncbi:hypothetical protein JWG41_04545 [Leptospira sp. 201903075]|uniref:hypothetical protein n=1 Tax=Leptospira chreensis TaxID=2810035 RepID=UPI001964CDD9|nr:hypothetical protein [Leptospira chreensis]MBM9589701.1 hypothetical protein [Leptospira chreensis]